MSSRPPAVVFALKRKAEGKEEGEGNAEPASKRARTEASAAQVAANTAPAAAPAPKKPAPAPEQQQPKKKTKKILFNDSKPAEKKQREQKKQSPPSSLSEADTAVNVLARVLLAMLVRYNRNGNEDLKQNIFERQTIMRWIANRDLEYTATNDAEQDKRPRLVDMILELRHWIGNLLSKDKRKGDRQQIAQRTMGHLQRVAEELFKDRMTEEGRTCLLRELLAMGWPTTGVEQSELAEEKPLIEAGKRPISAKVINCMETETFATATAATAWMMLVHCGRKAPREELRGVLREITTFHLAITKLLRGFRPDATAASLRIFTFSDVLNDDGFCAHSGIAGAVSYCLWDEIARVKARGSSADIRSGTNRLMSSTGIRRTVLMNAQKDGEFVDQKQLAEARRKIKAPGRNDKASTKARELEADFRAYQLRIGETLFKFATMDRATVHANRRPEIWDMWHDTDTLELEVLSGFFQARRNLVRKHWTAVSMAQHWRAHIQAVCRDILRPTRQTNWELRAEEVCKRYEARNLPILRNAHTGRRMLRALATLNRPETGEFEIESPPSLFLRYKMNKAVPFHMSDVPHPDVDYRYRGPGRPVVPNWNESPLVHLSRNQSGRPWWLDELVAIFGANSGADDLYWISVHQLTFSEALLDVQEQVNWLANYVQNPLDLLQVGLETTAKSKVASSAEWTQDFTIATPWAQSAMTESKGAVTIKALQFESMIFGLPFKNRYAIRPVTAHIVNADPRNPDNQKVNRLERGVFWNANRDGKALIWTKEMKVELTDTGFRIDTAKKANWLCSFYLHPFQDDKPGCHCVIHDIETLVVAHMQAYGLPVKLGQDTPPIYRQYLLQLWREWTQEHGRRCPWTPNGRLEINAAFDYRLEHLFEELDKPAVHARDRLAPTTDLKGLGAWQAWARRVEAATGEDEEPDVNQVMKKLESIRAERDVAVQQGRLGAWQPGQREARILLVYAKLVLKQTEELQLTLEDLKIYAEKQLMDELKPMDAFLQEDVNIDLQRSDGTFRAFEELKRNIRGGPRADVDVQMATESAPLDAKRIAAAAAAAEDARKIFEALKERIRGREKDAALMSQLSRAEERWQAADNELKKLEQEQKVADVELAKDKPLEDPENDRLEELSKKVMNKTATPRDLEEIQEIQNRTAAEIAKEEKEAREEEQKDGLTKDLAEEHSEDEEEEEEEEGGSEDEEEEEKKKKKGREGKMDLLPDVLASRLEESIAFEAAQSLATGLLEKHCIDGRLNHTRQRDVAFLASAMVAISRGRQRPPNAEDFLAMSRAVPYWWYRLAHYDIQHDPEAEGLAEKHEHTYSWPMLWAILCGWAAKSPGGNVLVFLPRETTEDDIRDIFLGMPGGESRKGITPSDALRVENAVRSQQRKPTSKVGGPKVFPIDNYGYIQRFLKSDAPSLPELLENVFRAIDSKDGGDPLAAAKLDFNVILDAVVALGNGVVQAFNSTRGLPKLTPIGLKEWIANVVAAETKSDGGPTAVLGDRHISLIALWRYFNEVGTALLLLNACDEEAEDAFLRAAQLLECTLNNAHVTLARSCLLRHLRVQDGRGGSVLTMHLRFTKLAAWRFLPSDRKPSNVLHALLDSWAELTDNAKKLDDLDDATRVNRLCNWPSDVLHAEDIFIGEGCLPSSLDSKWLGNAPFPTPTRCARIVLHPASLNSEDVIRLRLSAIIRDQILALLQLYWEGDERAAAEIQLREAYIHKLHDDAVNPRVHADELLIVAAQKHVQLPDEKYFVEACAADLQRQFEQDQKRIVRTVLTKEFLERMRPGGETEPKAMQSQTDIENFRENVLVSLGEPRVEAQEGVPEPLTQMHREMGWWHDFQMLVDEEYRNGFEREEADELKKMTQEAESAAAQAILSNAEASVEEKKWARQVLALNEAADEGKHKVPESPVAQAEAEDEGDAQANEGDAQAEAEDEGDAQAEAAATDEPALEDSQFGTGARVGVRLFR